MSKLLPRNIFCGTKAKPGGGDSEEATTPHHRGRPGGQPQDTPGTSGRPGDAVPVQGDPRGSVLPSASVRRPWPAVGWAPAKPGARSQEALGAGQGRSWDRAAEPDPAHSRRAPLLPRHVPFCEKKPRFLDSGSPAPRQPRPPLSPARGSGWESSSGQAVASGGRGLGGRAWGAGAGGQGLGGALLAARRAEEFQE